MSAKAVVGEQGAMGMDAVLMAVLAVGVAGVGGWLGYAVVGTAVDRKQGRTASAATGGAPKVELELGHVGSRSVFSRRRVVVRHDDRGIARIQLGWGLRRVRGECLANDEEYEVDLHRGWPLVRARWPLGRARVTMRRRSDGVTVGQAAQPRSWWRRMARRGGVGFTRDGVAYELRPMQGRRRGAQLRADDEPVGSFTPELGSTRCAATIPATLDEEARLFLVATAASFGLTISDGVGRPRAAVPAEAQGPPRGTPIGVAAGAGAGAGAGCGGGGGGGGGC